MALKPFARFFPRRDPSLDQLESELVRLEMSAADLAAEIERLSALEEDETNGASLLSAMANTRAARNRLRKLDGQITTARQNLKFASDPARAKQRAELLDAYKVVCAEFISKAEGARALFARVVAAREAVATAGFGQDHQQLPIVPNLGGSPFIATESLNGFKADLDRFYAEPRPAMSAPSAPIARAPTPQPASRPDAKAEAAAPPMPPASPRSSARRRALLRETAAPGERLVSIIRDGVDHPRKGQLLAGDIISLPHAEGEALLRSAAADWTVADAVTVAEPAIGAPASKPRK